jgi:hypothetical protein
MDLENYLACVCLDYGGNYEDKPEKPYAWILHKVLIQLYINGEKNMH